MNKILTIIRHSVTFIIFFTITATVYFLLADGGFADLFAGNFAGLILTGIYCMILYVSMLYRTQEEKPGKWHYRITWLTFAVLMMALAVWLSKAYGMAFGQKPTDNVQAGIFTIAITSANALFPFFYRGVKKIIPHQSEVN